MRICHYPGRVIDASLSLEQKSPMETIYQNNWLNADKTLRTVGSGNGSATSRKNSSSTGNYNRFASVSSNYDEAHIAPVDQSNIHDSIDNEKKSSISSLGKYQVTQEQVRKLELNQPNDYFKNTIRDLSVCYKPSTLRQKTRKTYSDWDDYSEGTSIDTSGYESQKSLNRLTENGTPKAEPRNKVDPIYANGESIMRVNPKMRRSQTVRYPASNKAAHRSGGGIRNMFQIQQLDNLNVGHLPTATISKSFNRSKRNNLQHQQNHIDEHTGAHDVHSNSQLFQMNESQFNKKFSTLSVRYDSPSTDVNGYPSGFDNGKISQSSIKKPTDTKSKTVSRAKSVRINPTPLADIYFDKYYGKGSGDDDNYYTDNGNEYVADNFNKHCDKRRADSNLLNGHSTSHNFNGNRNNVVQGKMDQLRPQSMPVNNVIANKQHQLSSVTLPRLNGHNSNINKSLSNRSKNYTKNKNYKRSLSTASSSSSASSVDESPGTTDFIIPRPRLIVPVHTYARKRRTGNLINNNQTHSSDELDGGDDVVVQQPRNPGWSSTKSNRTHNGKSIK